MFWNVRAAFLSAVVFFGLGCGSKSEAPSEVGAPRTFRIGDELIVKSAGFSPDNRWVIAGGENKRVKIIETETGNVIWVSDPMPDAVLAVGFSPDGKYFVVTTGDNTQNTGMVAVYNTDTRTERWAVKGLQNDVQLAKFSADGKTLIAANFYHILMYETETGRQTRFFSGHPIEVPAPYGHYDAVTDLVFTKDPNLFLSVSWDKKVLVWDVTVGHDVRTYSQGDPINAVILHPDDKRIITGSVETLQIWNRETDRSEALFSYDGEIRNLCTIDNGQHFISGDEQGDLTIWRMQDFARIKDIRKVHEKGLWGMTVSYDGSRMVSTGGDGAITIWGVSYLLNHDFSKDSTTRK